jgi:phosphoglycerol transferase
MKNFLINAVKKSYRDVVTIVLMLVVMCGFTYVFMDMDNFDLHYPMSYDGGDGMSYLVNAVMLLEGDSTLETDRLGAPYGYQGYDFYASNLHEVDNWILKAVVRITQEPVVAVNVTFLLLFPMITLFSYFALRQMRIRPWISAAGALTYAFMPYLFMRGMNHFVLACYYFVPISILYCVWIYEDERFFSIKKGFFKYWKNYFAIIMSFLIANNGISYYPFFTCFFLVIAGVVKAIREKKPRFLVKAGALIVLVAGFLVVGLIPCIRYVRANGANEDAFIRTIDGVETYSLKIAQLLLPIDSHGSYLLEQILRKYDENMPLVNENSMAYLGVMGSVGFIMLLVVLFMRHMKDKRGYRDQLEILALLNIAGVLLGTIGGFSSLFGLLVTDMIRCYNRISIFLAFICIAGACVALNALADWILARGYKRTWVKWLVYCGYGAVALGVSAFGIWFQYPGLRFDYVNFAAYYENDHEFVARIEEMMPEGAMIYQLPYHEYPEGGYVNDMNDYELWEGFIHSKTLKWSYGGVVGRESDNWLNTVNNDDVGEMLQAILEKGFSGVYIDRRAYEDEDIVQLENELVKLTGNEFIVSGNGAQSFIAIR